MSKHTPGPWDEKRRGPRDGIWIHADGRHVAYVAPDEIDPRGRECMTAEQRANALLIAAAPDLLDALEWVLGTESDCERCRRAKGRCVGHTALAKARGAS